VSAEETQAPSPATGQPGASMCGRSHSANLCAVLAEVLATAQAGGVVVGDGINTAITR